MNNNVIDMQGNEKSELELDVTRPAASEKTEKLTRQLEETNAQLEEIENAQNKARNEDMIFQEKEWLAKRMEEQRLAEEREREEIFEKQKSLEKMRKDQAEFSVQSRQMKIYNQMHEEEQRDQVYAIHGVSADKFEGMKEYKNALYQGAQILLLFADLALAAAAAFMYGYSSAVFVLFIALLASQISLLPREHRGQLNKSLYSVLSQIFSFIPTLIMIAVIAGKETGFADFDLMIFISAAVSVVLSVFGSLDYFVRNPYREYRKACREAKSDLASLKKDAAKAVRKNIRSRQKLENQLIRQKNRQEARLLREQQRDEIRYERAKKLEQARAEMNRQSLERAAKKQERHAELEEMRNINKTQRKEIWDKRIVDFKSKFNQLIKKRQEADGEGLNEAVNEAETESGSDSEQAI